MTILLSQNLILGTVSIRSTALKYLDELALLVLNDYFALAKSHPRYGVHSLYSIKILRRTGPPRS